MKYEKPLAGTDLINSIIKRVFGERPGKLEEIAGGEIARTYTFAIGDREYFIQFNRLNMSQGTATEEAYATRLSASGVPVRNIIEKKALGDLHYAITEKVQGQEMERLSTREIRSALPRVYKIMVDIAGTDIGDTEGYGWLKPDGNGMFSSWKEHLMSVLQEEPDGLFYGKWHGLFESTFLDRKEYEYYGGKMASLFGSIPEERYFQHGNLGLKNILFHEGRISAVIDWQEARFGDFLYDLSFFSFWQPGELSRLIEEDFLDFYEDRHGKIENYHERVTCCKYFIGLDGMRFFAKTDQKGGYDYTVDILKQMER